MNIILQSGDLTLDQLKAIHESQVCAIDSETSGLDPKKDQLCLVQICYDNTVVLVKEVQYPQRIWALLEAQNVLKIFHNAEFDLAFILKQAPYVCPRNVADSFLAAKVLDPKKQVFKSYSLQYLVKYYFDYTIDKSQRTSDWGGNYLTQEQLKYASDDVKYLAPLLLKLESSIPSRSYVNLERQYQMIARKAKERLC